MVKKQIELSVKFEAFIRSDDEHVPMSEVFAENAITLIIPVMDTKYTVFPKVLEGVTERVIDELNAQYVEWLRQKLEEKKRNEEEQSFLWNQNKVGGE